MKVKKKVAQSCPALCSPRDCSPPGPSVHGVSQARTLDGRDRHSLLQGSSTQGPKLCLLCWQVDSGQLSHLVL